METGLCAKAGAAANSKTPTKNIRFFMFVFPSMQAALRAGLSQRTALSEN
jgi:hypothetical protein